ncbi:hypothetical protein CCR96_02355 [Halochromatium roseum]|nr:hypothetical protein [Halochromatium roseum]
MQAADRYGSLASSGRKLVLIAERLGHSLGISLAVFFPFASEAGPDRRAVRIVAINAAAFGSASM